MTMKDPYKDSRIWAVLGRCPLFFYISIDDKFPVLSDLYVCYMHTAWPRARPCCKQLYLAHDEIKFVEILYVTHITSVSKLE